MLVQTVTTLYSTAAWFNGWFHNGSVEVRESETFAPAVCVGRIHKIDQDHEPIMAFTLTSVKLL